MLDIQGVEDFHGDMDFKVGGTRDGITAIQMDMKVDGLTYEIIEEAFEKCRKARLYILDEIMAPVIAEPRAELSKYAPKMLSMKIDVDKITEFRSTLEWGALENGVRQATAEQREKMMTYLENLENAETEEERVRWDKAIHYLLIEASGNFCMLANYKALNKIMDEYIPKMRGKIIEGMHSEQFLSRAHRTLAEGFAEGNIEKAREGLKLHFHYIYQYL